MTLFDKLWELYPRKQNKKYSRKVFEKINPSEELFAQMIEALKWQAPMLRKSEDRFRPLLSTWLNGERWEDEPPEAPQPSRPAPPPVVVDPAWARRYDEWMGRKMGSQRTMTGMAKETPETSSTTVATTRH